MKIEVDNIRKVQTFHGTDYYLDLEIPNGRKLTVQIGYVDYGKLLGKCGK